MEPSCLPDLSDTYGAQATPGDVNKGINNHKVRVTHN